MANALPALLANSGTAHIVYYSAQVVRHGTISLTYVNVPADWSGTVIAVFLAQLARSGTSHREHAHVPIPKISGQAPPARQSTVEPTNKSIHFL